MRRRRWYFPTVEVPRDAQEGVEDRGLRERGLRGQDTLELPTTVEMTLTISLRCNSRGTCGAYLGGIYGNHFLFKGFLCGVVHLVLCCATVCRVMCCRVVSSRVVWCCGAITLMQRSGWSCTQEHARLEGCVSKCTLGVFWYAPGTVRDTHTL